MNLVKDIYTQIKAALPATIKTFRLFSEIYLDDERHDGFGWPAVFFQVDENEFEGRSFGQEAAEDFRFSLRVVFDRPDHWLDENMLDTVQQVRDAVQLLRSGQGLDFQWGPLEFRHIRLEPERGALLEWLIQYETNVRELSVQREGTTAVPPPDLTLTVRGAVVGPPPATKGVVRWQGTDLAEIGAGEVYNIPEQAVTVKNSAGDTLASFTAYPMQTASLADMVLTLLDDSTVPVVITAGGAVDAPALVVMQAADGQVALDVVIGTDIVTATVAAEATINVNLGWAVTHDEGGGPGAPLSSLVGVELDAGDVLSFSFTPAGAGVASFRFTF